MKVKPATNRPSRRAVRRADSLRSEGKLKVEEPIARIIVNGRVRGIAYSEPEAYYIRDAIGGSIEWR